MRICVYPGSFDPVTLGHMDIITRAAALFDEVVVAVARHPDKKGTLPMEKRVEFLRKSCAALDNVRVDMFEGLTVQYARSVGACCMIRGLRAEMDFEGERVLAQTNRFLAPDMETVFLVGKPEHGFLSSSVVREMAGYSVDLTGCVPECVRQEISEFYAAQTAGR